MGRIKNVPDELFGMKKKSALLGSGKHAIYVKCKIRFIAKIYHGLLTALDYVDYVDDVISTGAMLCPVFVNRRKNHCFLRGLINTGL